MQISNRLSPLFSRLFFLVAIIALAHVARGEVNLQKKTLSWSFPIKRPHAGIPIANGTQGLLVWGEGETLNFTIAHQGFWDHRGGHTVSETGTFLELKQLLAQQEQDKIKAMFSNVKSPDQPSKFQQLGGGRVVLTLPKGWLLTEALLSLQTGLVTIYAKNPHGVIQKIKVSQAITKNFARIDLPPTLSHRVGMRLISAYSLAEEAYKARGIAQPDTISDEVGLVQHLPADPALVILVKHHKRAIWINTTICPDNDVEQAKKVAFPIVKTMDAEIAMWWKSYWASVPMVNLPDALLQEIFEYGLYMQAICTPEHGVACSLQGPLLEDYQMPPWSADYHWNINEQMIYWPSLSTGRANHQKPLWDLIKKMLPSMQQAAKQFYGIDNGLMMPHATDDLGKVSGSFWAGAIDAGCLAWMAQMAWDYYRYTGDTTHLKTIAYPLLSGAFYTYNAMLTDTLINGQKKYALPVTVSPEWRGSQFSAVGRNASFQLAALHSVCKILPEASGLLNVQIDPKWADVDLNLPSYSTVNQSKILEYPQYKHQRIGLFEGQDLIESHRHHSHLAGIYPFQTIDPMDTVLNNKAIIQNSAFNWTLKGAGTWTGWCTTWASTIHSYLSNADAAVSWLHYWNHNFVNEGRGTLHDAAFAGMSRAYKFEADKSPVNTEIMQFDARMGALNAVINILMHQKPSTVKLFPNKPKTWDNYSFRNLTVAGGFKVSGLVKDKKVVEVIVEATRAGTMKMENPIGAKLYFNDSLRTSQPQAFTFKASLPGDTWFLRDPSQKRRYPLVEWNPKKPKKMIYP